jgi:ketosteroid isomerase-like protein
MSGTGGALFKLHRAIETGEHGLALAAYFTHDAVTIEHPNLIAPTGGRYDLKAMLSGSERGAALLSEQRYRVNSIDELESLVVARLTWTATVAVAAGPFAKGQQLVAHIAQFATVRDDRIAHIETFDCYEPWTDSRHG